MEDSEVIFNIDSLMDETALHMEEDFYKKPFNFSYSSLNKLLWNPVVFHQLYIMQHRPKEILGPALVTGKVIHAIILDPGGETLKKDFLVSPAKLPTGKLRIVLDKVWNTFSERREKYPEAIPKLKLEHAHEQILDAMMEVDYHQSLKEDTSRLGKIITPEAESYWEFLKIKGDRELIAQETLDYCIAAAEVIKQNDQMRELLGLDVSKEFDECEVYNEIKLQTELNEYPFGIHGILDNYKVDHKRKRIIINDLKTTSGDLKDFKDSIEKYSYWLQAAIYFSIITTKYKNLLKEGYSVTFNFIVLDRNLQTYAFLVSGDTMMDWVNKMFDALYKAKYHYEERKYLLPYEFCRGEVIL